MVLQGVVYTCESSIIVRASQSTPATTILSSTSIFGLVLSLIIINWVMINMRNANKKEKPERFNLLVNVTLFQLVSFRNCFLLKKEKIKNAPEGARTPDLRITSAPSALHASTAYKYDALTDCGTGAG